MRRRKRIGRYPHHQGKGSAGGKELNAAGVGPVSPPVADPQSVSVREDTPLDSAPRGSGADGDPLTFELVTAAANGTLGGAT